MDHNENHLNVRLYKICSNQKFYHRIDIVWMPIINKMGKWENVIKQLEHTINLKLINSIINVYSLHKLCHISNYILLKILLKKKKICLP